MPPSDRKRLLNYVIVRPLGSGGMGDVYLARDTRLDRLVAIKILRGHYGALARSRLETEARAVAALNHPNILNLYEIGDWEGDPFLVFEYVDGRTLEQAIPPTGFPVPNAVSMARQIADALRAVDSAMLSHLDLKPSNVMLTPSGVVKLLDFGVARKHGASLRDGAIRRFPGDSNSTVGLYAGTPDVSQRYGTPLYMAPEQLSGTAVDVRADIFSFGALFFKLLTGRDAFAWDGCDRRALWRGSALLKIPRRYRELIESSLAEIPEQRPANFSEVLRVFSLSNASARTKIAAAVVVIVVLFVSARYALGPRGNSTREMVETQQTSLPGKVLFPALSPDESQLAFLWRDRGATRFDLYVQNMRGGSPRRIASAHRDTLHPVWSPDGKNLAYLQVEDGVGVSLTVHPMDGRPDRTFRALPMSTDVQTRSFSWFPDSRTIAATLSRPAPDATAIYGMDSVTGERWPLAMPPGQVSYSFPAVSSDGARLALIKGDLGGGSPAFMPLTIDRRSAGPIVELGVPSLSSTICTFPLWSGITGQMYVLAGKSQLGMRFWELDLPRTGNRTPPPRLLTGLRDRVITPTISAKGTLTMVHDVDDPNLWLLDLPSRQPRNASPGTLVVSSSKADVEPALSPNGDRLAYVSDRSGPRTVWISASDGSGAFSLPDIGDGSSMGSPNWSPDGSRLVFDVTGGSGLLSKIYLVDAREHSKPVQLTQGAYRNFVPVWSADGREIYYMSDRTGDFRIWRMNADGSGQKQLTTFDAYFPRASLDGRFIYYATYWARRTNVERLRLADGQREKVVEGSEGRCFRPVEDGLLFGRYNAENGFEVYLWNGKTCKETLMATTPSDSSGAITADRTGRRVVYTHFDRLGSDIFISRRIPSER